MSVKITSLKVKSFIIYGLCDPRDGKVRYIGKSTSGLVRPRKHLIPAKALSLNPGNIANVLAGRQKKTGGLTFAYAEAP